jgi:hypothetical protein
MAKLDVIEPQIFDFTKHLVALNVAPGIPASGK